MHNVRNALAAAAAATAAGVGLSEIARGLADFRPVQGRLQRTNARNGAVVLDDTYNANPDSVIAAIEVLARAAGRKFLVLGDMGEVGAHGAAFHAEIGRHARAPGVDRLYLLGSPCAHAAAAFGEGARHFGDIDALLAALEAELAREYRARKGFALHAHGTRSAGAHGRAGALDAAGSTAGSARSSSHWQ